MSAFVHTAIAINLAKYPVVLQLRRFLRRQCRAVLCKRIDAGSLALARAPTAALILQHAYIIECALPGIVLWVVPYGAEVFIAAAGYLAGVVVDAPVSVS